MILPTAEDLDPADRACAQQILNLLDDATLQALLDTTARRIGATPPARLERGLLPDEWVLCAHRRYGPSGTANSRDRFFATMPPKGNGIKPWVVPALAGEPDTPSGRRRVAVHLWRAVVAPKTP